MAITVAVDPGSTPGTFKVTVDGNPPAVLWIKWYSTTAATIDEPVLKATPYEDSGGNLVVDLLKYPAFPYSTADISLPPNTRWVLALAWVLDETNATLVRNSAKREFVPPTTTSSSSTSSTTGSSSTTESSTTGSSSTTESSTTGSSSTTESSTTGSSTTESSTTESSTTASSTTESSTTSGQSGMATWTWQDSGGGAQWVLTTPCGSGQASPPNFNGMALGDTAQTPCS